MGPRFRHLATPVGVEPLILDPANAGAVFQAASQFNALEMTGPGVSPRRGIAIYINDPTQGSNSTDLKICPKMGARMVLEKKYMYGLL